MEYIKSLVFQFITWFKTVVNREINELLAFENLNEDHTSNYLLMFFR